MIAADAMIDAVMILCDDSYSDDDDEVMDVRSIES